MVAKNSKNRDNMSKDNITDQLVGCEQKYVENKTIYVEYKNNSDSIMFGTLIAEIARKIEDNPDNVPKLLGYLSERLVSLTISHSGTEKALETVKEIFDIIEVDGYDIDIS